MGSIQSRFIKLITLSIRNSFFIHKAETFTQRKSFERLSVFTKYPRKVKFKTGQLAGLQSSTFYPKNGIENEVILYLHGGAYCVGSVKTHKSLMARIARSAGTKTIGINYRLAPDHPYPAALEDTFQAYMELLAEHKSIYLAGDSAGGGLALALMLKLKEENIKQPNAAVLISPWSDLAMTGESIQTKLHNDPLINPKILYYFAKHYIGDDDVKNPFISPLYADLTNLPPILIQVGGKEVLLDDATRLAKKLKKAGCDVELEVWTNMFHVWHYLGGILPEAKDAITNIGSFIKEKNQPFKKRSNYTTVEHDIS